MDHTFFDSLPLYSSLTGRIDHLQIKVFQNFAQALPIFFLSAFQTPLTRDSEKMGDVHGGNRAKQAQAWTTLL